VLLVPVPVQGDQAPAEIEAAIELLNNAASHGTSHGTPPVDLIVLARGGGSLEDLAAFNSERVARAIASSRLPVGSAIGHETDFTISDFAADLRAPTPSAAAELITEAQHKIAEHLATYEHRLERAARFQLLQARQRLTRSAAADRTESRVSMLLHRFAQRIDDLSQRLDSSLDRALRLRQSSVGELAATVLRHDPRQALAQARERLFACRTRIDRSTERLLQSFAAALSFLDARLHSLSPLSVLERGYALVLSADGALVRSAAQLATGDSVTTRLADGSFTSRVESTTAAESPSQPPASSTISKKRK
jgi:exodeoxyribonuclease VII large subunit